MFCNLPSGGVYYDWNRCVTAEKQDTGGLLYGRKAICPGGVVMWNKRHGEMWMIYGGIILLSGLSGTFLIGADASWKLILVPMVGGVIVPIVWMMWYHGRLIRKYKITG